MPRNYKRLPPFWRIDELLSLTNEHPSGLRWRETGEFVTRLHKQSGFYLVHIDNEEFLAHRIVYYLRTGDSPDSHAVKHHHYNLDKDNRKELEALWKPRKKTSKPSRGWD